MGHIKLTKVQIKLNGEVVVKDGRLEINDYSKGVFKKAIEHQLMKTNENSITFEDLIVSSNEVCNVEIDKEYEISGKWMKQENGIAISKDVVLKRVVFEKISTPQPLGDGKRMKFEFLFGRLYWNEYNL